MLSDEELLALRDNATFGKKSGEDFYYAAYSAIPRLIDEKSKAEQRLAMTTSILRLEICTCGSRPDPTDVPLDNLPGHHDWSCRFREVMQPVLALGSRPVSAQEASSHARL